MFYLWKLVGLNLQGELYGQFRQKQPHVSSGPSKEPYWCFSFQENSQNIPWYFLCSVPLFGALLGPSVKGEEADLRMQLPFWFCSSDPAGMALRSHRGKPLHPSRLVGLSLKPVKQGRGKWSSLQFSGLYTDRVNRISEYAFLQVQRRLWLLEREKEKSNGSVSLEDSQPANMSSLFLFSVSASSWSLSFTIWLFLSLSTAGCP